MNSTYEVLRLKDGAAFVKPGSMSKLAKADSVVFDCDGTLIDVRRSYDATIVRTVSSMMEGFLGRNAPIAKDGEELIMRIRRTGGFNGDWDTSYALSLFSVTALEGRVSGGPGEGRDTAEERLRSIVAGFASEKRLEGWKSVDRYLSDSGLDTAKLGELRRYMGYPGNPLASRLTATFDQVYYGEALFERVYGTRPETAYKEGLIDSETVIVTRETLSDLSAIVGPKKMAIATGRPFIAVEHALRGLLGFFDRESSVYIGDGDIFPELAVKLSKFKKPSGESLSLARRNFSSEVMLYVGDSAEDRLMVDNAGATRGAILFAGIYGSASDEEKQISYFTETESDLIVKDVNQIPGILEMARR
jgi:phosphoglycolate phosphatase-like HAD superfamily hydrolase